MYKDGRPSDKMVIMQISTNIKYFCMVLFKLNGEIGALLLGNLKGSASVSVIGLRIFGELEVRYRKLEYSYR